MNFEKYIDSLDPNKIWLYELQMDLANEAAIYLNKYNEIIDEKVTDCIPYIFTNLDTALKMENLISNLITEKAWDLSPDTRGGVFAVYSGGDYDVFTLEYRENDCVTIEYLDTEFHLRTFSFEVSFEAKVVEINKILNKVKVIEEND